MALGEDFIQKALETPINTEPPYPFTREAGPGGMGESRVHRRGGGAVLCSSVFLN